MFIIVVWKKRVEYFCLVFQKAMLFHFAHNKDTLWIFWWMLRNFLLSGTTLFSIWFWITIDLCMKYQFPNSWSFDVLNLYEKLFHISNSFSIQFVSGISEIIFVYLFVYFWSIRILLAILFGRKSVFNSKHWDYKKKYFNLFIWLSCDKLVSCNLYW